MVKICFVVADMALGGLSQSLMPYRGKARPDDYIVQIVPGLVVKIATARY
jgi:hypothetical protein